MDASDAPLDESILCAARNAFPVVYLQTLPGVCLQRNIGIRRARGSHVLLCDDDIEPPPDYLRRLTEYLHQHPSAGAVTGIVCEPDDVNGFSHGLQAPSFRHLLFSFLFQLTVWADVEVATGARLSGFPLMLLKRWYRLRGNTWSLAGWPLVTQARGPVLHTATYGLGAALVRRDWLLASPYDERLGAHGIGDNYGVALGFPGERPIAVLKDLPVLHHRAEENRLDPADAYLRRVLALDYFMRKSPRFSRLNTAFLAWSLVGKAIIFALRRRSDMLRRTIRALGLVMSARNPLVVEAANAGAQEPARHDP